MVRPRHAHYSAYSDIARCIERITGCFEMLSEWRTLSNVPWVITQHGQGIPPTPQEPPASRIPREPSMPSTRPPLFHLSMSPLQRGKGRSSVMASAYRSASRMTDQRIGVTADYTRKQDVAALPLILPGGCAPAEREAFWNRVEQHHRRQDAVTARTLDAALPQGLTRQQETTLAERFAHWLAETFHVAVDVGVHRMRGNPHLDVLLSACEVRPDGLGKKVVALDGIAHKRAKATVNPLELIRETWARMTNETLAEAGKVERVDHRSYQRQGVPLVPGFHLGRAAAAMERQEPGSTEVGARLAAIEEENETNHPELRRSREPKPERPKRQPRGGRKPRAVRPRAPLAGPGVPGSPDAVPLPGGSVAPARRRSIRR